MPSRHRDDRDRIAGLLAVRSGLIDASRLEAAFETWDPASAATLVDHLGAQAVLDAGGRSLLDGLLATHLARHDGDAGRCWADLAGRGGDPDATRTLAGGGSWVSVTGHGDEPAPAPGMGAASSLDAGAGGRFRVLRPHAKGGLGQVFVALDSELHREVALKQILDHHADDPVRRQRFQLEAEITGGLEHPGIVPVYGQGTDARGRPYYAMRFIQGESLREAIARFHGRIDPAAAGSAGPGRSLEFRQLLRRFLDVCNAIEYAHSRGVVHRDLKPANIVLGKHGETIVVDWGLAKARGDGATADPLADAPLIPHSASGSAETLPGHALGTPSYMSPEQAAGLGQPPGPLADVYGLGATLYCLLTGRHPVEGPDAVAVVNAVLAGAITPPHRHDPTVDRALEAVCLKALAREPSERYASARALADDVERWLADEPVTARAEPLVERVRRWQRQHRTLAISAAAALVMAVLGLGAVAVVQLRARQGMAARNAQLQAANAALEAQRRRAEDREARAIQAIDRFQEAVAGEEALRNTPELEALRRRLLKEPLSFFHALRDQLQADTDTRPESLHRLAEATVELALLTSDIGDSRDALILYREALASFETLAHGEPEILEYQAQAATVHREIGHLLNETGQMADARSHFEAALAAWQRLAPRDPDGARWAEELANCHDALGLADQTHRRPDEAMAHLVEARRIRLGLRQRFPDDPEIRRDLAFSHLNIAHQLRWDERWPEALAEYQASRTLRVALAQEFPEVMERQRELADTLRMLGHQLFLLERPVEALAEVEAARGLLDEQVRRHPSVQRLRTELADCLQQAAALHRDLQDHDRALAEFGQARDLLAAIVAANPAQELCRTSLAGSHQNLGLLHQIAGRFEAALAEYEAARGHFEGLIRSSSEPARFQAALADNLDSAGTLLRDHGRLDDALQRHTRAMGLREQLAGQHPGDAGFGTALVNSHAELASLRQAAGQPELALAELETARAIAEQRVREASSGSLRARRRELARVLLALGSQHCNLDQLAPGLECFEAARALFPQPADGDRPDRDDDPAILANTHERIGTVLRQAGQSAEAIQEFEAAIRLRTALLGREPATATAGPAPRADEQIRLLGDDLVQLAGVARSEQHLDAARARLDAALVWRRQELARAPGNPESRARLARCLTQQIDLLGQLGLDDARSQAQQELDALPSTAPPARP